MTPSHSGISEDIWRPGGSIDRDPDFDDGAGTVAGSGWSVAPNTSQALKENDNAGGKCERISIFYIYVKTYC